MQLEAQKSQHPITLTIQDLDITFIATTQEGLDGFIEITDLVLKGSTDLHVLTLLLDDRLNSQAVDQVESIYKEAK